VVGSAVTEGAWFEKAEDAVGAPSFKESATDRGELPAFEESVVALWEVLSGTGAEVSSSLCPAVTEAPPCKEATAREEVLSDCGAEAGAFVLSSTEGLVTVEVVAVAAVGTALGVKVSSVWISGYVSSPSVVFSTGGGEGTCTGISA
jgi:hypothetical protein